jgi:hypothetical protein
MRGLAQSALISVLLVLVPAVPSRANSSVHVVLGHKHLDQNDWPDAEKQTEIGLATSFGGKDWPVRTAVDALFTTEDAGQRGSRSIR